MHPALFVLHHGRRVDLDVHDVDGLLDSDPQHVGQLVERGTVLGLRVDQVTAVLFEDDLGREHVSSGRELGVDFGLREGQQLFVAFDGALVDLHQLAPAQDFVIALPHTKHDGEDGRPQAGFLGAGRQLCIADVGHRLAPPCVTQQRLHDGEKASVPAFEVCTGLVPVVPHACGPSERQPLNERCFESRRCLFNKDAQAVEVGVDVATTRGDAEERQPVAVGRIDALVDEVALVGRHGQGEIARQCNIDAIGERERPRQALLKIGALGLELAHQKRIRVLRTDGGSSEQAGPCDQENDCAHRAIHSPT